MRKTGPLVISAMLFALPVEARAVVVDFTFSAVVSGEPSDASDFPSVVAALPIGTTATGSLRFDAPFPTSALHLASGLVRIGTQTYSVDGARSNEGTLVNGQLFDTVSFHLVGSSIPSSDPTFQAGAMGLDISGLPDPDPLALPVLLDLKSDLVVTFTNNDHLTVFKYVPLTVRSAGLVAAVPEPATWAALVAGLGLVGWAARGTQRKPRSTE